MQNLKNRDWYSPQELSSAEWFPYKYGSIRSLIASGRLKATKFSPRRIRISGESINQFFKNHEQTN